MLLAFRASKQPQTNDDFLLTGLVYDGVYNTPIHNARIKDSVSGISVVTDERGFYQVYIPVSTDTMEMQFVVSAEGYPERNLGRFILGNTAKEKSTAVLVTMAKTEDLNKGQTNAVGIHGIMTQTMEEAGNYNFLLSKMQQIKEQQTKTPYEGHEPVQIIDGIPYAFANAAVAWFSKKDMEGFTDCKVWVEGKIMTIAEANSNYTRSQFSHVAAVPIATAKRFFDIDAPLLLLYKDSIPPMLRH